MSLRRAFAWMVCAGVVACGRDGAPGSSGGGASPSPSATSSVTPSTVSSSSAGAPDAAITRVVHLPVPVARASAELAQFGNEHLAEHAFDGDPSTAWCAVKLGQDAWVEGELATPQRVRRLVVRSGLGDRLGETGKTSSLHGRIDDAIVVLDAGGPGRELTVHLDPSTPLTTIEVPGDALVRTVRVRVVKATKGKKGDDVCLGEVALLGDLPTLAAPAGVVPPSHGAALDEALRMLPTKPRSAAADLLGALGWSGSARKLPLLTRLRGATRVRAQLDDDPEEESIVRVTFLQTMDRYLLQHDAIAILDDSSHDDVVLGRRLVRAQLCLGEASGIKPADVVLGDDPGAPPSVGLPELVRVATHAAHARSMDDVIVRWTYLDNCELGTVAGRDAMQILTVDRGAVETVAASFDTWDVPPSDWKATPAIMLTCSDGAEPCALGGAGVSFVRAQFDAASFWYR